MTGLEIWLLAVGLAMDCFAVSIASGIILKRARLRPMLVMAISFGFFQALMPLLGWIGASFFSHLIESIDHWIAFILLALIGANISVAMVSTRSASSSVPQAIAKTNACVARPPPQ